MLDLFLQLFATQLLFLLMSTDVVETYVHGKPALQSSVSPELSYLRHHYRTLWNMSE